MIEKRSKPLFHPPLLLNPPINRTSLTFPTDTIDLQFSTSPILLPALDNSCVDEQMESKTND